MVSSIFPYPALTVFRRAATCSRARSAILRRAGSHVTAQGRDRAVKGQYVSGGYFRAWAIVPAAGRLIQPQRRRSGRRRRGGPQRPIQPPPLRQPGARGRPDRAHQRQAVHRDRRRTGVVLRRRAGRHSGRLRSDARRCRAQVGAASAVPERSLLLDRDHGAAEARRERRSRRRRCSHRDFTTTSPARRRPRRSGSRSARS